MSGQTNNFDDQAIQSLQEAAKLISEAADILKNNKTNYQATNLPVEAAVSHVLACLIKDATYLNQLSDICVQSAPSLGKFENE